MFSAMPVKPAASLPHDASRIRDRDWRFNRRVEDSAWLKHLCGFDIDLFDAMQAVANHA